MSRLLFQRALLAAKVAVATLVVAASAAYAAQRVVRSSSTPRGAAAPAGFRISGRLASPLVPGTSRALDLKLTNPHRWSLIVSRVSVDVYVDAQHEKAGCYRVTHFRQVRIPDRFYPLRLRPKSSRTLRQLGVTVLPRLIMRDLPFDQSSCQDASLRLRFAGRSVRAGRPAAR